MLSSFYSSNITHFNEEHFESESKLISMMLTYIVLKNFLIKFYTMHLVKNKSAHPYQPPWDKAQGQLTKIEEGNMQSPHISLPGSCNFKPVM